MRKLILTAMALFPLLATELTLKEGFVAAHTEMAMDSTIDPMASHLATKLVMDGDVTTIRGSVTVQLTDLSSDNADRDENMQETFESTQYPLAQYRIGSITKNADGSYSIDGEMELHGVKKNLQFEGEILEGEADVTISAKSKILMSEFGLEIPCMVFLCVRDQVDLFAKVVLSK